MLTTYRTTLTKKTQLTHNVWSFGFDLKDPAELNFSTGQYLILRVPSTTGEYIRRPLSIITPASQKQSFELLFKIVPGGAASEYLTKLLIGSEVGFDGPAGKFDLKDNNRTKIFLATGTGIAPIKSMLYQIHNSKFRIMNYLFWGLPKHEDVYYFDELIAMTKDNLNFQFTICLSKEKNLDMINEPERKYFTIGRVNGAVDKLVSSYGFSGLKGLAGCEFYLCGGRTIVDSLREYLLGKGISPEDIIFEKF